MIAIPSFRPAVMGGLHPTAVARIDAIYAAGGTCPAGNAGAKLLLSNFIRAEELAGRWSLIKRLYLPGFGNAAANAIDIIGGTSGSFPVGAGVTHAVGYVQGNGTTGYFDFGAGTSPAALGITTASGTLFELVTQAFTIGTEAVSIASADASDTTKVMDLNHRTADIKFSHNTIASGSGAVEAALTRVNQLGIFVASRNAGTRAIYQRRASGFSTLVSATAGDFGTVPSAKNLNAMRSNYGAGVAYSNARLGCFGIGLGISQAGAEAFSANLKTLWEGLFSLTLP